MLAPGWRTAFKGVTYCQNVVRELIIVTLKSESIFHVHLDGFRFMLMACKDHGLQWRWRKWAGVARNRRFTFGKL